MPARLWRRRRMFSLPELMASVNTDLLMLSSTRCNLAIHAI